jgi:hypothetical protein
VPAIAFAVGLVFGVTFDTSGRPGRAREEIVDGTETHVEPRAERHVVADRPNDGERDHVGDAHGVRSGDRVVTTGPAGRDHDVGVAEPVVDRDQDGVDDRDEEREDADRPGRGLPGN